LMVRWEKIDPKRKRPTQCLKCQSWGHSARNCGRDYRCVKCTSIHEPGKCSRTTREGTAKCVNCDGDHPANSRECPVFITYAAKTSKRRVPVQPRRFTSTPAPWAQPRGTNYDSNFPSLDSEESEDDEDYQPQPRRRSVSFTQSRSSSKRESPSGMNFDQVSSTFSRFATIPNIADTFKKFMALTEELMSATSQADQLQIMMRFCLPVSANVP
jgi:hypothetical protein